MEQLLELELHWLYTLIGAFPHKFSFLLSTVGEQIIASGTHSWLLVLHRPYSKEIATSLQDICKPMTTKTDSPIWDMTDQYGAYSASFLCPCSPQCGSIGSQVGIFKSEDSINAMVLAQTGYIALWPTSHGFFIPSLHNWCSCYQLIQWESQRSIVAFFHSAWPLFKFTRRINVGDDAEMTDETPLFYHCPIIQYT